MTKIVTAALVLPLLLPAGRSDAQSIRRLSLDDVTGLRNVDTIYSDYPIVFHIRLTAIAPPESSVVALSNGFRIYSPTGAEWFAASGAFTPAITMQMLPSKVVSPHSVTGSGADTIVFLGSIIFGTCGLPATFDEVAMVLAIGPIDNAWAGHTICLDSAGVVPSEIWSWQLGLCDVWDGAVAPTWDGPHCFTIARNPCLDVVMGDADHNGVINTADLIMMINVLFKGAYYDCLLYLDANCNCIVTAADVVYAVNYVFKSGPVPCNECHDDCFDWIDPPCVVPPQP